MNPQHREFFKELRILCEKHSAAIGKMGDGNLVVSFSDNARYMLPGVVGYGHVYVTEQVEHMIIVDEEPQP